MLSYSEAKKATQGPGWVYLIGPAEEPSFIKIGHSCQPKARLASLQTAWPLQLKVHLLIKGSVALERILHETFAPLRLQGEWFKVQYKLQAFMQHLEEEEITDFNGLHTAIYDVISHDGVPHPVIDQEGWIESADSVPLLDLLATIDWEELRHGN